MKIPKKIKTIIQSYALEIDIEKEYDIEYLNTLYPKIILFLDKKINKASLVDEPIKECTTDLNNLKSFVENEYESLGFLGQLAKYNTDYLETLHPQEVYTIADTLVALSKTNKLSIPQLFNDIVANYGSIPNYTYGGINE